MKKRLIKMLSKTLGLSWVTDLVEWLNGRKLMIGLISLCLHLLGAVPAVFPEAGLPIGLAESIDAALKSVGLVLIPVGAGHKLVKAAGGE